MSKDANSFGHDKALAWESRGFVYTKKRMHRFDTPSSFSSNYQRLYVMRTFKFFLSSAFQYLTDTQCCSTLYTINAAQLIDRYMITA